MKTQDTIPVPNPARLSPAAPGAQGRTGQPSSLTRADGGAPNTHLMLAADDKTVLSEISERITELIGKHRPDQMVSLAHVV